MNQHTKRLRCLRYIGSKIRMTDRIAKHLHASGGDCIVDVFGGSGAVVMNTGFKKRVYNDREDELVNFFRVLSNDDSRRALLRHLRALPMSRTLFNEMQSIRRGNDPRDLAVEKAAALFYVSSYCFGGKLTNGGFAASTGDRVEVKEIRRYQSILRRLAEVGDFWKNTVIENQDFADCIKAYGNRENTVLYCDPPYVGTELYYRGRFKAVDHRRLAETLAAVKSPAVVSYYPNELVSELYPEKDGWQYVSITASKNSMGRGSPLGNKNSEELLICRGTGRLNDLPLFADLNQTTTTTTKDEHA